jgi:hypothetical protein
MLIQEVLPKLTVADVFITHELDRRAPKKADYLQEKLALQDLAARMVDHPEDVLPRFVCSGSPPANAPPIACAIKPF